MRYFLFLSLLLLVPTLMHASYKGPPSDNFDGNKFHNLAPSGKRKSLFSFLKLRPWRFNSSSEEKWEWREIQQIAPTTLNTSENQLIFINHATFLLKIDGANILTDPIWSKRSGPFGRLGPSRVHNPGLKFEDLPNIDFVVISHNHFDHMDLPTLKKIEKKFKPIFIVGLGNSRYLKFIDKDRLIELDWWKSISFSGLKIFFVPAQHWSFRGRFDMNESLWGGFFIQSSNNSVLFSGDTAEGPHFEMIRKKIGSPDLALIPIGAYLPREFMKPSHLGPSEAIDAFRALGAKKAIAMHFGTFPLGTDGPTQASKELKLLLTEEDLSERFKIPFPGMIQYLDK